MKPGVIIHALWECNKVRYIFDFAEQRNLSTNIREVSEDWIRPHMLHYLRLPIRANKLGGHLHNTWRSNLESGGGLTSLK